MKSLLIIGTGSIGERHLRCFQSTGRCRVAACEPNQALRDTIQSRYKCEVYGELDEALAAGSWEAAVICSPAHTHISIARRCIAAGVSVLIEKPLATSLDGVDALALEAETAGRTVRVAYVHRSIPTIISTRELVKSERIGPIRHVVVCSGQHFPSFRPAYASTYFAKRATGGGTIQDALTHIIHAVEWIAGPVESVICDASHQVLETGEVEDTVNLIARLQGGIPASFAQNQFQAPNETTISFHGVKGSLRAELHRQRIGVMLEGETEWTWASPPEEERDAMFVRQAEAFLGACEGRPDNLSTLAEATQTLRVNLAALKSSDTQTLVKVSTLA